MQVKAIVIGDNCGLSDRIGMLISDMLERWDQLDQRIAAFDAEFLAEARHDEAAHRLTSIPGIGALNATALVAAVGDANVRHRLSMSASGNEDDGLTVDRCSASLWRKMAL